MSAIFRQKCFSEYDAMRQLYVAIMRSGADRNKIGIITPNQLIPTLRGNNIVVEKFTQATRVFGKDRYRMYIKIGARAKLPDSVRLPQYTSIKSLGNLNLGLDFGFKPDFNKGDQGGQVKQITASYIFKPDDLEQREFGKKNRKGGGNNNGGGGGNGGNFVSASFKPNIDFLNYEVNKLLGEAISYNKADRSLVLEFETIEDAIRALNILPFGLVNYGIYLLNA